MKKKRTTTLVIVIVFLMAMALLVVFLMSRRGPEKEAIVLPSPSPSGRPQDPDDHQEKPEDDGSAGITPETVKEVIAFMSRPESYHRTLSVRLDGTEVETAEVWRREGLTRVTSVRGETVRNVITSDDTVWLWYDRESVYSGPLGDFSDDDEQRIPSYEDILDSDDITAARFLEASDMVRESCVYVELTPEAGIVEQYWISFETGLLVRSAVVEGGETVYLMVQTSVEAPVTSAEVFENAFTLPDGTTLSP